MLTSVEADRMAVLLEPFLGGTPLSAGLAAQLQAYLDLLRRWNARMNLTAVRDPGQIVTRHFGESLFAARVLQDCGAFAAGAATTMADVGSGAGFPGLPIKLFATEVHVTLIESQNKKATFLREVIRTLGLQAVEVYAGRAEHFGQTSNIVTMRAAERFEAALSTATRLVAPQGYLCLLLGLSQRGAARSSLTPDIKWRVESEAPLSHSRVVMVGELAEKR